LKTSIQSVVFLNRLQLLLTAQTSDIMANASSIWKNECLMLRGIAGFFLVLSSLCHAHASAEVGIDLMKRGGCIERERRSLLAVKTGIY